MLLHKNTCSRLACIFNTQQSLRTFEFSFSPQTAKKKNQIKYPEQYTIQSDPHSNEMLYNNTEHIEFIRIFLTTKFLLLQEIIYTYTRLSIYKYV